MPALSEFTICGSSHKRKDSKEVNTQRKRPRVDRVIEDVRDAQSRKAADGSDSNITTLPSQVTPVISASPPMNHGTRDTQSREAGDAVDPDLTSQKETATESPSMTLFQGSSNFQISNSNINAIGGNATIIRFGDDQFTDVQRNLICDYIANLAVLPDIKDNLKKHVLTQSIISLPRAKAMFDDYQNKKKCGSCFKGTREALLREMADWATSQGESRMYVLSGLAGIGKSTVAYTIASRAAVLGLLGASFFFSRDEADRKNAERFFTTIAYQLCVYDETFSEAIGGVLLTERGSAATTKDPQEQLQALIVDPLQRIVQSRSRPILIVVDALDECDEEDGRSVLTGLRQLVRVLPSFKVILTTRPQPYLDHFLRSQDGLRIFHLQNIEDKIVNGDIKLYLQHCLSLEEVQRRYPKRQWYASKEGIDSLVHAAGRLFIIASTAVRYIFDKSASNPAAQMQKLLNAFAQAYTPFKDLDHFYTVILRNAVPADCDDDDIVVRYQSVVGGIIFVQQPLPVSTLAHLIDTGVEDIHAVLDHLQSIILLDDDDVPHIYHKSLPDYLTDRTRCKDHRLQIDPRSCHLQIVTRCFEIMDKHLRRNILGLGDLARFMSNENGLKKDEITDEQLEERIPQILRYTCVYWGNHLKVANIEDSDLMNGLEKFADEHMLYWFEVLSLIGKLDLAHVTIRVVLKLLKPTSSDLHQLLSDALRFISKFYGVIEQSALHTYYSALPFAPTNSVLYRRYIKETADNICSIEGGPEKWDALVATLDHGELVNIIKFSLDSTLFVTFSEHFEGSEDDSDKDGEEGVEEDDEVEDGEEEDETDSSFELIQEGKLKIWDAATGTPISTIPGHRFAVARDFSTVASSEDKSLTFYNINGSAIATMFTTSSRIEKLALSSESSRVAAALSDGTVCLLESRDAELIDSFDEFEVPEPLIYDLKFRSRLEFSPTGTRLVYSSANGIVKLRDGISGRFIADLQCGSGNKLEFSGDGSRIASLSKSRLTLWNSENGTLIDTVSSVIFAISANGCLLVTAERGKVTLRSENNGSLALIEELKVDDDQPHWMTFSLDDILVLATSFGVIRLYDVKTHSFISTLTLPFRRFLMAPLALSPDCTHFAVWDMFKLFNGSVYLWDIRGIDTSSDECLEEEGTAVTALALSRDCSRLVCGFEDGRVELLETSPTKRRIVEHQAHKGSVRVLGFGPDGGLFASGSGDGTTKLWNGKDGSLRGTLKVPRALRAMALSSDVLVAGHGDSDVTLWSLDTLSLIHTLGGFSGTLSTVSIAENSALIAVSSANSNDSSGVSNSSSDDDSSNNDSNNNESNNNDSNSNSDEDSSNNSDSDDELSAVVSLLDVVNHTTIATFDVPYRIHTMTFLPDNLQLVVQSTDGVFLSLHRINKHITKGPMLEHLIQLPNISLWRGVPVWHCQDRGQHCFSALFSQHKSPVPVLRIPRGLHVTRWCQGSSMIALGCRDGRVILLRPSTNHVS